MTCQHCPNCGSPLLTRVEKVLQIFREKGASSCTEMKAAYELRYAEDLSETMARGIIRYLKSQGDIVAVERRVYGPKRELAYGLVR